MSELSPAKSRGRLVSAEGNLIAFGVVVAYFFNIGMSYLPSSNPAQWRLPIAFQAVFIILQIGLVIFLPESPRWLAKRECYFFFFLNDIEPFTKCIHLQVVVILRRWTFLYSYQVNLCLRGMAEAQKLKAEIDRVLVSLFGHHFLRGCSS